jgi:hypothetical protein
VADRQAAATHGNPQVIEFIGRDPRHGVCQCTPAMSQPREIAAGATYLITRRVLRRHLLLRPDAEISQLLIYALAVSTRR